jgi:hypothetical protein
MKNAIKAGIPGFLSLSCPFIRETRHTCNLTFSPWRPAPAEGCWAQQAQLRGSSPAPQF